MNRFTAVRQWCREQISVFPRDHLFPHTKAKGMRDYVPDHCNDSVDLYLDLWSWIIRNSDVLPGGRLLPHDGYGLDYWGDPAETKRTLCELRLWELYLCSDGLIRCVYDEHIAERIRDTMYRLDMEQSETEVT